MRKLLFVCLFLSTLVCNAQPPSYVPTNGLVGWWPFNGNANDESGNGNNGTVNGATLTTDRFGNAGKAYAYNGVNNFIAVPNISSFGNQARTFSAWVYFNNINTSAVSDCFMSTGSPSQSATFNFRLVTGKLDIMGYNNDYFDSAGITLTNSKWFHCVVTYDGLVLKFYLNGQIQGSYNISSPFSTSGQSNYFGKSNHIGWEYYLNGSLDDVSIFNRALTQSEITGLYNAGTNTCLPSYLPTTALVGYWPFCGNANDASGNGNNGTVNGATLTTDRFGNAGKAYSFDGVNDFIQCLSAGPQGNANVSFGCWIKTAQTSTGMIAGYGSDGAFDYGRDFNVFINASLSGCSSGFTFDTHGAALTKNSVWDNQWHYFVIVYDGTNSDNAIDAKIYRDGVLIQSSCTEWSGGPPPYLTNFANQNALRFGKYHGTVKPVGFDFSNPNYFNGSLDDIAIWNRALSATEVQNLYNASAPTSCIANITNNDTTICTGQSVVLNASNGGNVTQNISSLTREWTNSFSTSNGIFKKAIIFDSSMVISGSNWPSWPSGTTDQMITKIGLDGSLKWRNVRAPGPDHDGYQSVYRYPNGNLLFFGQQNAQGTNYFDGFWTRFDANGNELNYGFFNVAGSTSGTDVKRLHNGKFVFSGPDQSSSYITLTDTNFNRLVYQTYPTGGWNSVFVLCDSQNIYSIGNLSNSANFKLVKYDTLLSVIQSTDLPNNGVGTSYGVYDAELINGFIYVAGYRVVNSILNGVLYKISKNGVVLDSLIDPDRSEYTAVVGNNGKLFLAKSFLNSSGYSTSNKIIEFTGNGQTGAQYTLNNGSPFSVTDLNVNNNYIYASGAAGSAIVGIPAVEKIKINYSATSTSTYLWSTGATTPSITVSPTTTTTYYLTVTDANGNTCRDSVKITVNTAIPGTPGSITGATDVCPSFASTTASTSSPVTYSIAAMSTATSYTWTLPAGATLVSGQGTPSITVSFANSFVSGTLSVKANNACGSSASARTLTVYRRIVSTPGVIQKSFTPSVAAVTSVCGLVSEEYRIRKVSYATSYNWSLARGTNATLTRLNPPGVNDTAIRITFAAGFTRDTIRVTAQNACSVSALRTSTLNATAAPPAITDLSTVGGNFTVCIGTTRSFTALTTAPTSSQSAVQFFRWTKPANTTITSSSADSSTITLRIDAGFTGGSVSVRTVSACGVLGSSRSVTLQYLPPTPSAISSSTGSYNACIGTPVTYSALVGQATTSQSVATVFRWTRPANTSIVSAASDSSTLTLQFNTGFIGGVLSVRGQSSCGAQGSLRSVTLTHTGCPPGTRSATPYAEKGENTATDSWQAELFPNPTTQAFQLLTSGAGSLPEVVQVRDAQGRLMQSFRIGHGVRTSFGHELPSGVYFIEVLRGTDRKLIRGVKF